MTDPINSQNRLRTAVISADSKAGSSAQAQGKAGAASMAKGGDSSSVELHSTTLVQELESQIKNLPEVNQARVEAVKQALGNGEYQTDAEVIAQKYIEIEKLLP